MKTLPADKLIEATYHDPVIEASTDKNLDSAEDRVDIIYHMYKTSYRRERTILKCNIVLGSALTITGISSVITGLFQDAYISNALLFFGTLCLGEGLGELKALNMLMESNLSEENRTKTIFKMSKPSYMMLNQSKQFNIVFGSFVSTSGLASAVMHYYQNVSSTYFFWHPFLIGTLLLGAGLGEKNILNMLQKKN